MIPARVEPCFDTFMKISPGVPSSYSPTVTKPLQSATRKAIVRDWRDRGSLRRRGTVTTRSTTFSTTSATTSAGAFFAIDSGWATLQLSR